MEARKEWFEKDYYAVLGVDSDATQKQITQSYRKLARELHPDANPDNQAAEDRFKEVSAAYDVLGDEEKRKQYDEARRYATIGPGQAGGGYTFRFDGGDLEDLLGGFFGSGGPFSRGGSSAGFGRVPAQGADQDAELSLSFDEAVAGLTTDVTITDGQGPRDIRVRIPAGVDDGQRIRIAGKGGPGRNGGPAGDLYVTVRVRPHRLFGRSGRDLTLTLPISFAEAALGADVKVPTFDGEPVTLRIPPGTPNGKTFRVRGRGVTTTKGTGDLLVTVEVAVPTELNRDQRAAVEALAAATGESPRAHLEA